MEITYWRKLVKLIPQENQEECLKSAKTFKFSLPVISMDTRCEPSKGDEDPSMLSI